MKKGKVRAYCPRCRHQQIFVRAQIHHLQHLILSILTGGLWLVSWAALCIGKIMRPWRCEHCGWHKPEFLSHKQPQPGAREPVPVASPELHPGPLIAAETSKLRP